MDRQTFEFRPVGLYKVRRSIDCRLDKLIEIGVLKHKSRQLFAAADPNAVFVVPADPNDDA